MISITRIIDFITLSYVTKARKTNPNPDPNPNKHKYNYKYTTNSNKNRTKLIPVKLLTSVRERWMQDICVKE